MGNSKFCSCNRCTKYSDNGGKESADDNGQSRLDLSFFFFVLVPLVVVVVLLVLVMPLEATLLILLVTVDGVIVVFF